MEALFQFFEKLVTQFSWRRLGMALTLLAFVFVGFTVYESYTAAFRLGRIERTARVLEALVKLEANETLYQNPALTEVHRKLVDRLALLTGVGPSGEVLPPVLLKALSAVFPWLTVCIPFLWQRARGDESAGKALLGVIVIAVPLVIIGGVLPLSRHTWINYWAYPWGSLFCVLTLILLFSKIVDKRKARDQES